MAICDEGGVIGRGSKGQSKREGKAGLGGGIILLLRDSFCGVTGSGQWASVSEEGSGRGGADLIVRELRIVNLSWNCLSEPHIP